MTLFMIGFLAMKLLCTAFVVLLVVRIAVAIHDRGPHSARAILDRRFASGECSAEDYRARRSVLES